VKLSWRGFSLDFSERTYIMGVLNVTPDSFSDGGLFFDPEKAVEHAFKLVEDGADILDIGGESTRPGSDPVSVEDELRRTVPVIEAVAKSVRVPISIDTYKAEVARRALEAGAALVNDISGFRFDRDMPGVVASSRVPAILMHIKGNPKDMQKDPVYEALIPEVMDYLRIGIRLADTFGIPEDMILVDPGIGFGKTFEHNLEILNGLDGFTHLGRPLVVGVSRKAFIGRILDNASATERLEGTAAAVAIAIFNGANIVRVHDVKDMTKVAKVADAIKRKRIAVGQ
jgi:dihydropteroate synthase